MILCKWYLVLTKFGQYINADSWNQLSPKSTAQCLAHLMMPEKRDGEFILIFQRRYFVSSACLAKQRTFSGLSVDFQWTSTAISSFASENSRTGISLLNCKPNHACLAPRVVFEPKPWADRERNPDYSTFPIPKTGKLANNPKYTDTVKHVITVCRF